MSRPRWALRRIPSLVALAMILVPAASRADEPKITTETDLIYTKVGETALKLDLSRPAEGDGPFPGVLVIHGGGWRGGNKADNRGLIEGFARRGYVAISPEYRFCPRETFPAQVLDVKAAVRWLKAHAKDYKLDPDHIGAVGFSAGGHLSLMLGLTGPSDGLEGEAPEDAPETRIAAVVNFFGPTDLTAGDFPDVTKPLIRDFLGGTPAEKPKEAAQASPLTFVSKGDAPVLTFQGTRDPLVPHTQATRLADALTRAGVHGRVELLLGAGHGWGGDDRKRTLDEMYVFFDQYLKPERR